MTLRLALDDLASLDARADRLEDLAGQDRPLSEVLPEIRALADASLNTGQVLGYLTELRDAVRLRDGLATRALDWRVEVPDLTCPDPADAAEQYGCVKVGEALWPLLRGDGPRACQWCSATRTPGQIRPAMPSSENCDEHQQPVLAQGGAA